MSLKLAIENMCETYIMHYIFVLGFTISHISCTIFLCYDLLSILLNEEYLKLLPNNSSTNSWQKIPFTEESRNLFNRQPFFTWASSYDCETTCCNDAHTEHEYSIYKFIFFSNNDKNIFLEIKIMISIYT